MFFKSLSVLYVWPLASTMAITFNFPSVIVPVLSVNKILMLPAVSIPMSLRTRILLLSILFILDDKTKVIIIGSPSGTATTIMVTLRVKALRIKANMSGKLVIVWYILSGSKLLSITISENRYDIVTRAAPTYPILLINSASLTNLSFKGLVGFFSLTSSASLP